jgi:hypothetical protein
MQCINNVNLKRTSMQTIWFGLVALSMATMEAHADDETEFTSPPPVAWTRFNPLGAASFDFSGGMARLSSPAPSAFAYGIYGPARLALFAPTSYTQTVVSVDLVSWSADRNVPGIIARAGNLGLGATRGYSFGFIPSTREAAIHRVTGEYPTVISPIISMPVIPGQSYRMVLVCAGNVITGRVFSLTNLAVPLVEVTATDATYASGLTGILNSTDQIGAIDATFDNFLAWDGTPASLGVTTGEETMRISTSLMRSLATNLEATDDLALPWLKVFPDVSINGSQLENEVSTLLPPRFYRRRLLGAP